MFLLAQCILYDLNVAPADCTAPCSEDLQLHFHWAPPNLPKLVFNLFPDIELN